MTFGIFRLWVYGSKLNHLNFYFETSKLYVEPRRELTVNFALHLLSQLVIN